MTSYQALRSDAAFIDLSDRGKIFVTGEDRARLLHAMSTNHVSGLAPWHGLYAFFLSAQGRILADAAIYNLEDRFLLDTEPELRQKLLDHLDKYIIADDAYLEDGTDRWAAIGIEGPKSIAKAAQLGIAVSEERISRPGSPETANAAGNPAGASLLCALPEEHFGISKCENGLVARAAATGPVGLRLFIPVADKAALLARLASAGIPQATAEEARTVRIENRLPRYGEEITERFLVQETGVLLGVHFDKGCYIGQEIVERVRSRAQVHRHLARLRIPGVSVPAAGTKLQVNGKDVAEIVSGAYSPALGAVICFAYVRTEALAERPEMQVPGSSAPATLL